MELDPKNMGGDHRIMCVSARVKLTEALYTKFGNDTPRSGQDSAHCADPASLPNSERVKHAWLVKHD